MGDKTPPKIRVSPWKKAINFANFVRTKGKVSLVDASIWANMGIPWFKLQMLPYVSKFEDIQYDGKYFVCIDQALNAASESKAPEQAPAVPVQAVQAVQGGP